MSQNTRKAAAAYLEKGFAVVPIPRGRKGPVIKDWPTLTVDEQNLDSLFHDDSNIGLILGDRSGE